MTHPWTPFDEFRIELDGEEGISSIIKSYANKSWAATMDLFGTEGSLHVDLHSNVVIRDRPKESLRPLTIGLHSFGNASRTVSGVFLNALKTIAGRMKYGQDIVIERFVDCVLDSCEPPVSAEDSKQTVRVAEMLIDRLIKKYGSSFPTPDVT